MVASLLYPPHPGPAARRGFTMIELMITLIIVAILASVGTVMYNELLSPALGGEVKSALSALRKAQRTYKSTTGSYATSKEQLINDGYMQEGDFSGLHYVTWDSLQVQDPAENAEGIVAVWDGTDGGASIDRFKYAKVKLKMNGEWVKLKEDELD